MQALNPVLVMLLIPIFEAAVFPGLSRLGLKLTPLRKMSAGMLLTSLSFLIVASLQVQSCHESFFFGLKRYTCS